MEPVLSADERKELRDALGEAQRIGMLGRASLEDVIERSLGFVRRLPIGTTTVIDMGSGGGDPGLVIAMASPHVKMTLVDRRAKRTDLLTRLVGRLGLVDRVDVVEADVADLGVLFPGREWDVATSRGFGTPAYTAEHASPVVRLNGLLLVSEPPDSDGSRWQVDGVEQAGFRLETVQFGVAKMIKFR